MLNRFKNSANIFLLILCLNTYSQDFSKKYTDLIKKAANYYQAKNYKSAAIAYSMAFKSNDNIANVSDRYNAASCWALANEPDSAFYHLNFIINYQDFSKYDVIKNDVDLRVLHKDKRWGQLLKAVEKNIAKKEALLNKPLMKELDSIIENDQKYRVKVNETIETFGLDSKEFQELRSTIIYYDSINLIKVRHIINNYGWLGEDVIGENGNTALFLVIQHADLKTQKEFLPIMRDAVKNGNAKKQQLALLEDRVALGEGRKQIYGSQIIKSVYNGKDTLAPVEDFKNINKRRLEMDLEPIEEYLKLWGIVLTKEKSIDDSKGLSNGDFESAIEITDSIYGPTNVGTGYGKTLDFNFNVSYSEKNSAWYKFTITKDTMLTFDIVSKNLIDDYDFIFFKCNNPPDCINDIRSNKIKPDRWCFDDNFEKKGSTGLSTAVKETHIPLGPSNTHASAINVKAGDTFYLMVTFNYERKPAGFTIYFYDYWSKKPSKLKMSKSIFSKELKNNGDCITANQLSIKQSLIYQSPSPPSGFGKILEQLKTNNHLIAGEHNSAWHLISIENDGEFEFKISPADSSNDYDFIVYPYIDSNTCNLLSEGKVIPLRSNFSNIKNSKKGITGIQKGKHKNDVGKGMGDPFSNSITVKKGEKYLVFIDNFTTNGKGYTIQFDILKKIKIKGEIADTDNKSIVADIELYDDKGEQLAKIKSGKDGKYEMDALVKGEKNYFLTISSDSTFIEAKTIYTNSMSESGEYPYIKTVLSKLKKGGKYKLGNIVFYGDKDELLPYSMPSVNALAKLLKKHKQMIILIEGHTNGEDWHLDGNFQNKKEKELSIKRAQKIYDLLVSKGIEKSRLSIVGLGSTIPLYSKPKDETEASANRRVEIKIISMGGEIN